MLYTEVNVKLKPFKVDARDILQALMGSIGFDSFEDHQEGFKAYIQSTLFSEVDLNEIINHLPIQVKVEFSSEEIPEQNWNETWEKNYFKPIVIGDQVLIRSSFHKTDAKCKYEILIDPKMAFGTGHHSTTWLVADRMTRMEFDNKRVLDMGCGTGILAILAGMKGAKDLVGIDIDEWAYQNCLENIKLNGQQNIDIRLGGSEKIGNDQFDVVLANINRNILLGDMAHYAKAIIPGGSILFSGFYTEDLPIIRESAESQGLSFIDSADKKNWVVAEFRKNK